MKSYLKAAFVGLLTVLSFSAFADGPTQDHHDHTGPQIPDAAFQSPFDTPPDNSITIFDHELAFRNRQMIIQQRGIPVYKDGHSLLPAGHTPSPAAIEAYNNLKYIKDFFQRRFGLNSFDNQGTAVHASVNVAVLLATMGVQEAIAWTPVLKVFSVGYGGDRFGNLASALDTMAHEYTHAIVSSSSRLLLYGVNGAINEHLGDFFGAFVERSKVFADRGTLSGYNPFLLGEDTIVNRRLRRRYSAVKNMLEPQLSIPLTVLGQEVAPFKHFSEIPDWLRTNCRVSREVKNDTCGIHLLAGLPNRAIALSVDHIGWDKMSKMIFKVMREELRPTDNLFDYRDVLLAECARVSAQLPARSCEVLRQSFATVGL